MMPRTKVNRTKLFRIVQQCYEQDAKFKPTIQDCREIFNNINRQVFNGELKMPNFRLVYSKEYWGECIGNIDDNSKCTIKINKSFLSRRLFINTLAHEMVHQWEWLTNEDMTHGRQFFQWRKEMEKYGIILSRSYRIRHYKLD